MNGNFKFILTIITILFTITSQARQIKIAVLDTGFTSAYNNKISLCETGHKDFTGEGLEDIHKTKHGTNIAGIIDNTAVNNYCIMIIKVFYGSEGESQKIDHTVKGVKWALKHGAEVINYSGGGFESSSNERQVFKEALDKGIYIISAAGNDNTNLNTKPFYPAAYDNRIIVVGNGNKTSRYSKSNYGNIVDFYINGEDITALGITLTGSSQSTAIATGLMVNALSVEKVAKND